MGGSHKDIGLYDGGGPGRPGDAEAGRGRPSSRAIKENPLFKGNPLYCKWESLVTPQEAAAAAEVAGGSGPPGDGAPPETEHPPRTTPNADDAGAGATPAPREMARLR